MKSVYITRVGKFLPNTPISNDEMDQYIGLINQSQSRAKHIVLRNNGIKTRYYAIDKNGVSTHSNADLNLEAIRSIIDEDFKLSDIELLSCGTSSPDHLLPSHAAMIHGLMKAKPIEINSAMGVCSAGMSALKYAFMSVQTGNTKNAVSCGSEKISTWLHSQKFEEEVVNLQKLEEIPMLAFKKDFLRYMLSDGAGAFLLENEKRGDLSLKIEWIEFISYANEVETCMYAGGDKLKDGSIKPWNDYLPNEWLKKSIFSIKQDVKLLESNIIQRGVDSLRIASKKHNLNIDEIDYYLPHVSSNFFVDKLRNGLAEAGMPIPAEKWFMNLFKVGNVGAASIYLMLEELINTRKLESGQKILLSVPESGRFSYSSALLTVC